MDDEDLTEMLTEQEMLDLASQMSLEAWDADGVNDSCDDIDPKDSSVDSLSSTNATPPQTTMYASYPEGGRSRGGIPISESVKLSGGSMDYSAGAASSLDSVSSKGSEGLPMRPAVQTSVVGSKQKLFSKKKIIKSVNQAVSGFSRHLDWLQKKYIGTEFDGIQDVATSDEINMSAALEASLQDRHLEGGHSRQSSGAGLAGSDLQMDAIQDDQIVTKLLYSIRRKDRKETYNSASVLLTLCRGAEAPVIIQQLQQVGAIGTLLSTLKRSSDWPEVEIQLATLIAVMIPHETEWTTIIRHATDILTALADLLVMKVSPGGNALSSLPKPSSSLTRSTDGIALGTPGRFPSMSSANDLTILPQQDVINTRSRNNSLILPGSEAPSPAPKSRPVSGRRRSIGGSILSKSLSVDTGVGFAEALGAAVKGVVDMGSSSSSASSLPPPIDVSQPHDAVADEMGDKTSRDNFRYIMSLAITKLTSVLCAEWSKSNPVARSGGGGFAAYANKSGRPMSTNLQMPIEDMDLLMTTNASVNEDETDSFIGSRPRGNSVDLLSGGSNIGGPTGGRVGGGNVRSNTSNGHADMLKNLGILMNIIDMICGSSSAVPAVDVNSSGGSALFAFSNRQNSPKLSPKPTIAKTFSFTGGKDINLFGSSNIGTSSTPLVDAFQQGSSAALIMETCRIDPATVTCSFAVAQIAQVTACRQSFVSNGALKLLMTWLNMCIDCIVNLHKQKLLSLDSKVYTPLVELLTNTCSAALSLATMEDTPFGLNNSNNEYSIGWTDAQVLGVGIPTALVKLLLVSQGVSAMIAEIDVPEVQHMMKVIESLVSVGDKCAHFPAFPAVCRLQLAESLSNLASRQHNRNQLINAHVPIMLYMLFIDCVGGMMNEDEDARPNFSVSSLGDDNSIARFISSCLNGLRCFLDDQYSSLIDLLCADEFLDCLYFVLFRVNTHPKLVDCRLAVVRLLAMFTEWGQAIDCLMCYSPSTNPAIFAVNDNFNHEDDTFVTLLLAVAVDNEEKGSSKYRRRMNRDYQSTPLHSGNSGHSMSALAQSVGHAFGFAGGGSLSGIVDNVVSSSQQAISGITSGFGFNSPTAADKQQNSPPPAPPHGPFFGPGGNSTPSSPLKTIHTQAKDNANSTANSSTGPPSAGSPTPISGGYVMPPKPGPVERDISTASNLSVGAMSHTSFGEDTICSSALVISVQMAEQMALSAIFANMCVFNPSYAVTCHQKGLLSLALALMKKRNEQIKRQAVRCIKALSPILLTTPLLLKPPTSNSNQSLHLSHKYGRASLGRTQSNSLPPVHSSTPVSAVATNNDELGLRALQSLIRAFEIENPGIQRDALLGIIELAKTDNEYRRAICDSIVFGPLKSFVGILLDPYSERDIRILAEEVLNAVGFHGLADLELCQYDVQLLLDWYKLRRLCTMQQLVFDYDLSQWLSNDLFGLEEDGEDDCTTMHSHNWNRTGGSTESNQSHEEEAKPLSGRNSIGGSENSSSSLLGSAAGGTFRHTLFEHSPLHKMSRHGSSPMLMAGKAPMLHKTITDGVMKYLMPNVLCFGQPRSFSTQSMSSEGVSGTVPSSAMKGEGLSMVMERDDDKDSDSAGEGGGDEDGPRDSLGSNLGSNISKVMTSLYDTPTQDNADGNDREASTSVFDGIEYSPYVENVMPYDGKDMLPLAVQEMLETFYPSKLQHHIITGLMALGSEVISEKHIDNKTHLVYETCYSVPKHKPIMAILFPSRPYLSFKRVGRIIEKSIQEHIIAAKRQENACTTVEVDEPNQPGISTLESLKNAQLNLTSAGDVTAGCEWALTFRNSVFEGEFHISFLSTLRKCPQITALNFVSAAVYQDTTLGWLAGHVPNSVQFMAFQQALSSDAIDSLCILLKQNNASFKRNPTMGSTSTGDGGLLGMVYRAGSDPAYIHPKDRKGLRGLSITHTALTLKDVEVLMDLITRSSGGSSMRGGGSGKDAKLEVGSAETVADMPLYIRQQLLPNPPGLVYLDLSSNKLPDQTCGEILLAVCRSGTIEGLDLSGSYMHKAHSFIDMLRKLSSPFLSGQCKLKYLGLRDNNLQGKFLCRFLDAIKEYKCLTSLDLSSNDFPYSVHFKENMRTFLRTNKDVRKLDLCNCKLNGESTKAVHLGLLENETLLLLPLARNMAALHSPEFPLVQEKLASNRRLYQQHRGSVRLNINDVARMNGVSSDGNLPVADVTSAVAAVSGGGSGDATSSSSGLVIAEAVPIPGDPSIAIDVASGASVAGSSEGSTALGSAVAVASTAGPGSPGINSEGAITGVSPREHRVAGPPGAQTGNNLTSAGDGSNGSPETSFADSTGSSAFAGGIGERMLQSSALLPGRERIITVVPERSAHTPPTDAVTNTFSRDSSTTRLIGRTSSSTSSFEAPTPPLKPTVGHAEPESSWTDRGLSNAYHATSGAAQRNELRVMFASPLAWRDRNQKFHAIPMLDYISERDQLLQVFKEVNRNISVGFDFATTDKLRTALSFGCRALHFSGHGHPNCLNFEDGRSGLQLLSNEALKDLVNAGGLKLEFLFVSACHSRKTGEAFVEAGVKHVVCVKVEEKVR